MHHIHTQNRRFPALVLTGAICFTITASYSQHPEAGTQQTGSLPATPQYSGYFQPGFSYDNHGNGGFFLKRASFSATAAFAGPISWKVQADLAGQPRLLDAILRIRVFPGLVVSAGQFKIPVSRENLLSSASLCTVTRSQAVEALTARGGDPLGNQNGRDIGIMLDGGITRHRRTVIAYSLAIVNGSGINRTDGDHWKDLAARISVAPRSGLTLAVSSYYGRCRFSAAGNGSERSRIGADIAWSLGSCLFVAEYLRGRDGDTDKNGWYLLTRFPLSGEQLYGVLKFDRFTADASPAGNYSDIWTIGLTCRIDTHSRVLINHSLTDRNISKRTCGTTLIILQTGF